MSRQPPSNSPDTNLRWRAVGDRAPAPAEAPAVAETAAPEVAPTAADFAHLFPPAPSPYAHSS